MNQDKKHWENIYQTKLPAEASWTEKVPQTSLTFIHSFHLPKSARIIDVGGGESTLVDDLLARGYQNITVLDVSQTAIDVTRKRLGWVSEHVQWTNTDIANSELAPNAYDTFGPEGPTKCSGT